MSRRFHCGNIRRAACLVVAVLWPAAAVFPREMPPRPQVPPPVAATINIPAQSVLPNGLRVIVIERHSAPLVSVNAMVMSGAECDPQGREGLADMTAGLLAQGTQKRTALQIAKEINQAGGTVDAGADWDKTLISVGVLGGQQDRAFDVLSDILIHPAFRPAEIERLRKQTLSALQVLWQDPSYVANAAIRRLVFAGSPYAYPADGTVESNNRIARADLIQFHDRYYRPGNTVLAILGDISTNEAFQLAQKYFGNWKNSVGPALAPAPTASSISNEKSSSSKREVLVIDKPDSVQTEIRVGNAGIPRSSPDYVALTAANQILGGPAANLLFQALRTERGLAYGASSELDSYRDTGAWIAKTSTRTPETDEALKVMLEQIKQLDGHSIHGDELQMARNYLTGHMALEFESMDGVAAHMLELMLYGLPLDYWNNFPAAIDRLTPGDVQGVVRHYIRPDKEAIVLVGNAAQFADKLRKFGKVKIIPIDRLDLNSPTLEREAAPALAP